MTAIKDHWCDSTHKKDFVKKEFPDKEPTNFILERIPWHKTFIQEKPSQYSMKEHIQERISTGNTAHSYRKGLKAMKAFQQEPTHNMKGFNHRRALLFEIINKRSDSS
jgi:hypothetical protein